MLVPTIKLLEFSDKNWETYERLIIFWSIFDYFFYCPKFQKWNFIKNPWYRKIIECTTLIFHKKLDFFHFFFRKFLLTVFHIIFGEFYFFYCPKFQIWIFRKNPWYSIIQHCTTLIFHKKLDFCDFF